VVRIPQQDLELAEIAERRGEDPGDLAAIRGIVQRSSSAIPTKSCSLSPPL
jgi:hypothetical protein